ncbi:MAG: S-methyl-5-thioribose-1-phosphate isomerase, partial [Planctomycetota bacterium]|nr:S-methyl-5-thioribose-1-phosphate isomerase [Planctomycetota bacterium]
MTALDIVRPCRYANGAFEILDQTLLPGEERWLSLTTPDEVIEAISVLRIRGAPAIGVAGAYAMVLAAGTAEDVRAAASGIASARPTAVNLRWAVERMLRVLDAAPADAPRAALEVEAKAIRDEDEKSCRAIGRHGAALLGARANVLTHCNAGSLATAGYGTALGVIYAAVEAGKTIAVFADETRPLLQGARLTAWELARAGIDVTLLADSVAGSLLASGRIDAVVVGADRVAANGDVANKVGTYPVAVLADAHDVPFYVAAPRSTVDPLCPDGAAIPIEERGATEVTEGFGVRTAPEGVYVYAPAFDVTPARLVTALI